MTSPWYASSTIPDRIQAAGLNRAIAVAQGDIIVRVDGHCVLAADYVERCVAALDATGAAMVGGGDAPGPPERRATVPNEGSRPPWGAGSVPVRLASMCRCAAGWVDTVYLGRVSDRRR